MSCCGNSNKSDSAVSKAVCPVMGNAVDKREAVEKSLVREYKGEKYYFCCDGCPQKFEKNPAYYVKTSAISDKGGCC